MFTFLKNLFKKDNKDIKNTNSDFKKKKKVKDPQKVKEIKLQNIEKARAKRLFNKHSKYIGVCTCGRKTVIKNHSSTINEDKTHTYTFNIQCPKCKRTVSGTGNKLDVAKKNCSYFWNIERENLTKEKSNKEK